MRWTPSTLITGMQSLFSGAHGGHDPKFQSILEDVRGAMLESLEQAGITEGPVITLRVTYARNLQDLWYMRSDVMAAISAIDGEAAARRKLMQISDLFKGNLPNGLRTRPSPLDDET